ncbi:unnamed protein product [Coffea canephora]|uniref:Knottin scorpion toxin-like domain-containing protein n=1 Tax=Coffea canephora TaxID=49390 RepID=A0A068VBN9_COFCA|nr:unnamed protein product [Coffea canephora]
MGAKGIITVATLVLMAMLITVNSDEQMAPIPDPFHQKSLIYLCYKKCSDDCLLKKDITHKCFLNCHHQCLGFLTAHPVQYCSMGCSMARCSQFRNDAAKKEECEKSCSKYCNGKV